MKTHTTATIVNLLKNLRNSLVSSGIQGTTVIPSEMMVMHATV